MVSKLELKHIHQCSAKKSVHYHEYRKLAMHAKCVIEDNDETSIWPNKTYSCADNNADVKEMASNEYYGDMVSFDTTYRRNKHRLPFASFVGVNHYGKSTRLGYALLGNEKIPSFENVFPNTRYQWCIWHILKKIPAKLGGYAWYRKIHAKMNDITFMMIDECGFQSFFFVNFGQECTSSMFREVQQEFKKKCDCLICGVTQDCDLFRVNVDEQYLLYGESRYCTYGIDFDPLTYKVFMTCDEEAAMLHSALDDVRAKLIDYRANLGSKNVVGTYNNMAT
ncbi:hypothetical protein Ahy_B03g066825 [Arachis hypogaea]|uniref:MULE transposase domain-containing protein n=1 Tax=Arachis hypogaea TaxID=3818 RepID=A0A445A518_ARAHY|nr:hypothetical protein Ahy_B03g066825 [Arachis hypogaea]